MSPDEKRHQAIEGNTSAWPSPNNARLHPNSPSPARGSPGRGSPARESPARDESPNAPSIVVHDFERATNYEYDDDDVDPLTPRPRRGTIYRDTSEQRPASPPSSVKAFAASRRRSRRHTFCSDAGSEWEEQLARAGSFSEGRHKPPTVYEARIGSVAPIEEECLRSREADDRCDDGRGENDEEYPECKEQLFIDYEYLEQFMFAERERHSHSEASPRVFSDMRQSQSGTEKFMTTSEGEFMSIQPPESSDSDEKKKSPSAIQIMAAQFDKRRFSFCSSTWDSTLYAPEFADLAPSGESMRDLFERSMVDEDTWWLNCTNVTKQEVQGLGKAFGIHPLTIEDIITHEPHEKVELFSSYYFASFQSFHPVEEDDAISYKGFSIYLLIFRQGVLSFSFVPNSHASFVRQKMMALKESVSVSSDWICYAIIDHIVDSFAPVIRRMEVEVDSIDDDVFIMREDDKKTILKRIGQARKNCMALFRLLSGKADVLGGFTKRCNENYPMAPRMDIGVYLSDIQDHVLTMSGNITHFETILARAHSNYLATVSICNHSQSLTTNRALGKVTLLAGIFVPLQLVTSVFGMNVPVPWQLVSNDNLVPFFAIGGCMLGFALLVLLIARWLRFL